MVIFLSRLLRHENLGRCLLGDIFESVTLLANDEPDVFIVDFDKLLRISERIRLADVNLRFIDSSVLADDGFNGLLGEQVLFMRTLDEDVADVGVLDLGFGNLDFGTALVLQAPYCFARLADDQANSVIWHHNDVGVG